MSPEEIEEMWKHLILHLEEPAMHHIIQDLQASFSMNWSHCKEWAPGPHLATLLRLLQEGVRDS